MEHVLCLNFSTYKHSIGDIKMQIVNILTPIIGYSCQSFTIANKCEQNIKFRIKC